MSIQIDKTRLVQIVKHRLPDVIAVYLFGSASTDKMTSSSDLDIAVLVNRHLDTDIAYELKTDLASNFKRDVDLVDMLLADSVTSAQVILTGELLFVGDAKACAVFETSALAKFLQLNEERRGILEDIEKRGSVYG